MAAVRGSPVTQHEDRTTGPGISPSLWATFGHEASRGPPAARSEVAGGGGKALETDDPEEMARGGIEPPTPRFSVTEQDTKVW
jgi:hypothetical protein